MGKPIASFLLLAALAASPLIADEGRIPVFGPITINQPGDYVLTRDISVSGGHAVTIRSNNVTLDLNGHTIVSSGVSFSDDVILVSTAFATNGVTIRNGRIQGGYSGILSDNFNAVRIRIQGVEIQRSAYIGLYITIGEEADIEDCYVHDAANAGMTIVSHGGTIVGNIVEGVGGYGIWVQGLRAGQVLRNVVRNFGSAFVNVAGILLSGSAPLGTFAGALVQGNSVGALPGGTDDDGIVIANTSSNDLVIENNASYNGRFGIFTLGDGTRLERNVASHNGTEGIRIGNADPSGMRCHLEANQIVDNPCGIEFVNGPTHSYRNNLLRGNTTAVCGIGAGNLDAGGNIF